MLYSKVSKLSSFVGVTHYIKSNMLYLPVSEFVAVTSITNSFYYKLTYLLRYSNIQNDTF